jgi:hypothetical protein
VQHPAPEENPIMKNRHLSSLLVWSLACGCSDYNGRFVLPTPATPAGASPARLFLDRDGDTFGGDAAPLDGVATAGGTAERGGDCDDDDPLRYPEVTEPVFDTDRCGEGEPVFEMDSSEGWTLFKSNVSTGAATLQTRSTGCRAGGLTLDYLLPTPTPCGPAEAPGSTQCSWLVWQRALGSLDLSAQDYLLLPFAGSAGSPLGQLELKLSSAGCLRSLVVSDATQLPVQRTLVVPLRWFSVAPRESCAVDLSSVTGLELAVSRSEPETAAATGSRPGHLELDALTAVTRDQLAVPVTHFACPPRTPEDVALAARIAADLLARHHRSLAGLGHPFVPSWYEETPSRYYSYNQALLLIALVLEAEHSGDARYAEAAASVADELVALQLEDGRWRDVYLDAPAGGLQGDATTSSWVGNVAWVLIALHTLRDRLSRNTAAVVYDAAIERAADWLESQVIAFAAAGGHSGAITTGSEGNVSSALALIAAGRFDAARQISAFILSRLWDARERRLFMGLDDPGLALDVMGSWGVDWLRALGKHADALASLELSAGIFPVRSFDGRDLGLGDIAGPWQPAFEFVAQYVAAGGPGGSLLMSAVHAHEVSGALPGSPADFAGGPGWNTSWHGVAPSAMTHIALRGGVLNRLRLPSVEPDAARSVRRRLSRPTSR